MELPLHPTESRKYPATKCVDVEGIITCLPFMYSLLQIAPGLGQSETFYSWVLTIFNIGVVLGALLAGGLVKLFPYWHVVFFSLLMHSLSYIIYAVSMEIWLIAASKLISGIYIGIIYTISYSYIGESYDNYRTALKQLGKEEGRIKDMLFGLHAVSLSGGYILGPG